MSNPIKIHYVCIKKKKHNQLPGGKSVYSNKSRNYRAMELVDRNLGQLWSLCLRIQRKINTERREIEAIKKKTKKELLQMQTITSEIKTLLVRINSRSETEKEKCNAIKFSKMKHRKKRLKRKEEEKEENSQWHMEQYQRAQYDI